MRHHRAALAVGRSPVGRMVPPAHHPGAAHHRHSAQQFRETAHAHATFA